ncbi:hypothetical protein [Sphingobacterium multivorum]|uniref:hypothetical protein n=1 Tax=Sphingobacterium multivorum TaxID=28454 RepID=UPI0028A61073|nr:hypothetical protein [Sphingobacterium multivorum]
MEDETQKFSSTSAVDDRIQKIFRYVEAYNEMNVEGMITDFDDGIVFLNIMNGEKSMELKGIEEFKKQAIDALSYFSARVKTLYTVTARLHIPHHTTPLFRSKVVLPHFWW